MMIKIDDDECGWLVATDYFDKDHDLTANGDVWGHDKIIAGDEGYKVFGC